MRVGYEAKRAFGNATGLGNYARTLIAGVAEHCPRWTLYLFTPYRKILFSPPGARAITPQWPWKLSPSLWCSYGATARIRELKLDLFHGLSQEIPRGIHRTTRTVVTVHDLIPLLRPRDFSWPDRTIYGHKLHYCTSHAHHVLTFSEDTKGHLIRLLRVPEQKITILPQSCHSAFLQSYSPREIVRCREQFSLRRPYAHFVGSFIPRKRPWECLQAFQKIADKVDWDFVMIGRGPLRKRCQDLIRERGLTGRAHLIAPESPREMAQIVQGSQLLIYPSVAEGFGIPILEAHFSRTAVMASGDSCLPEIAGDHAYYTNPDDPQRFSSDLEMAMASTREREQRAQRSCDWAKQHFTPEVATQKLLQFYRSL